VPAFGQKSVPHRDRGLMAGKAWVLIRQEASSTSRLPFQLKPGQAWRERALEMLMEK